MNWYPVRAWLGTVVRLFLGVVWIWAGWSKLTDPRGFVQTIRAYDATPEWLSKAMGYGLPVLEICLGVLLIVGIAVRLAAAASALLFLVFLIGLAQAAARDIRLECGCFGGGGQTTGATHYTIDILRDVGLLILAAYLVVWSMTRLSMEEFLARNDYVEPPSPKRMRTEQGQRKYNVMMEQRRKAARERALYLNGSLALVVVLVSIIGIGVQSGRAKIQGSLSATNVSVQTGLAYGKTAAATVEVFEDFQCPHCLEFEQSVHSVLEADVKANKAQVRYHPIAFLDSASNGNRYSTRAANAAICASDAGVDTFVAYHDLLFTPAVQPKEGSKGRSDADLVRYAQQIKLTEPDKVTAFTTCVNTEQHKALVEALTENASKRGVTGTPTVLVNGKALKSPDLASLEKAIAAADAKGPAPSPSETVTPKSSSSKSSTPSSTKSSG